MPGYWTVAALLYLGGMIYGALLTLNEDRTFPLTKEERADAWFIVLAWPVSLPYLLLSSDDEE